MKILGITGGSNTGKSSLVKALRAQTAHPVVYFDADAELHHLYAHDAEVIAAIGDLCPDAIQNGAVDRRALGDFYFASDANATAVEDITRDKIRSAFHERVAEHQHEADTVFLLDMPLLTELGLQRYCDTVLLTTCDPAERAERGAARIAASRKIPHDEAAAFFANILRRQTGLPSTERAHLSIEEAAQLGDDNKRKKLAGSYYVEIDTSNAIYDRTRAETEADTIQQALDAMEGLFKEKGMPSSYRR